MTKESDSPKDESQTGSLPKDESQTDYLQRNLDKLKLELSSINQGIQSYIMGQRVNGNWGASRYRIGDEDDGKTDEDAPYSDGENYSVYNYADEDDDAQSIFRCPFCDFEIEFSLLRTRLQEVHSYDPKNMICPVCDEKLGEDAIKVAQHSSSRKRTWKSEKSSFSSGDSVVIDKKLPTRGGKHESMADPLLSPFVCNVSVPNSSGILASDDSSSSASDISNAKSIRTDTSPDMSGDEEDNEERRLRASFVQELVSFLVKLACIIQIESLESSTMTENRIE
ncbi:hypothetical protein VNO77_09505 [Canavalia gladiata]|uniref:Uncharacterized protein n=1 Tax=Canavalia gladiata TaxID=3824 RepID=A0AAN9MA19_CANGL